MKRGQATIYIILGLILVLSITLLIYVTEKKEITKEKIEKERLKFTAQQQDIEKQLGKLADWPKMYTSAPSLLV